jgi:anti-sigma28 factor (negative regulator of flagellin synthesis)
MSLRIQNDAATGAASPEVSRSQQSSSVSSGTGKSRTVSSTEGGDHIDVSSATESISAGLSAQNQQRAARVTQLSALYASGRYAVDSAQVSHAIVSSAVNGSAAGEG